jgi:2-pyrone-4,6-dicarboxylate lactonase
MPKDQLFALRDHLGFDKQRDRAGHLPRLRTTAPWSTPACLQRQGARRGHRQAQRDRRRTAGHARRRRARRALQLRQAPGRLHAADELLEIANRIAPLGWHVVVYFEAQDLPELYDFFTALPTTVVVDHMGRPDVSKPVDGPEFALFVKMMREHSNIWSKVSCPERLSVTGPKALNGEQHAYQDVVPFAKHLVETFPDRVLWGTDWPHPNLKDHMPDDGLLVDFIPQIATTAELQRKLLVDNPTRLYWS